MKKNTIVIIVLSIIIIVLLNYIIFSTVSKTSIIEFLKLPVLGSIIVALVSIITVYLTNSFNLKKIKLETANAIYKTQFEKEFNIYLELWALILEVEIKIEKLATAALLFEEETHPSPILIEEETATFHKVLNNLAVAAKKHTPFYSKVIYNKIFELIRVTKGINDHALKVTKQKLKHDYEVEHLSQKTIENIKNNFLIKKEETSLEISKRIENLKVIN